MSGNELLKTIQDEKEIIDKAADAFEHDDVVQGVRLLKKLKISKPAALIRDIEEAMKRSNISVLLWVIEDAVGKLRVRSKLLSLIRKGRV